MARKIKFRPNKEKVLEGLVWIANEKPGLTRYYLVKIMYRAEKLHLLKYGRPIYGDPLFAFKAGPVPTIAYDLAKENFSHRTKGMGDSFYRALSVCDNRDGYRAFNALRSPDLDWFSVSELDCMREAFNEISVLPFRKIKNATHDEPEYIGTELNKRIDYEKILDDGTPQSEELISRLAEQGRLMAL